MRIGIDARILGHPRSGIAVYVVNLVREFLKDKDIHAVLFTDRQFCGEYKDITGRVEYIVFGESGRKRWPQVYLPRQLKKFGIDLYHATWNNAVPVFTACPCVLTVHDIIPLVVKGYFKNARRRLKYTMSMRQALAKARIVLANSECTRKDVNRVFGTPFDKIKVVYLGAEDYGKDTGSDGGVKKKYGIDADYIINIGSFDPRRNTENLIKAFAGFVSDEGRDMRLVLIGGYKRFSAQKKRLERSIKESGVSGRVIFTGHAPQKDMDALVSGARLMVHASLYEGFCFPLLEAMGRGVAVAASYTGSLPEIAGNAALLFNPRNANEIKEAIRKLWTDEALRRDMIRKGSERVKGFSWEQTARETKKIYKEVLS